MLVARVLEHWLGGAQAEIGSGSTPRNGAASTATVAAESPRPAIIWASRPPNECPMTAGFLSSVSITDA